MKKVTHFYFLTGRLWGTGRWTSRGYGLRSSRSSNPDSVTCLLTGAGCFQSLPLSTFFWEAGMLTGQEMNKKEMNLSH